MPVLKTLKNGVWQPVSGMSEHSHTQNDITDFPSSLPADGGNADTLDGKHADEFATKDDLANISGGASTIPDDEMLELMAEMDIVQPLANKNNNVYIDANDKVYVL